MRILDQVREVVSGTGRAVFGEPYEKNGVTVIPMARVRGGGGGGQAEDGEGGGAGVGLDARPVGAFVIKGESVAWLPAVDINRIILGGQILVIVAILSWRSVAKANAKARR